MSMHFSSYDNKTFIIINRKPDCQPPHILHQISSQLKGTASNAL